MNFIRDLIAKGVSQTGAVEVLLGEPLSVHTDRLILGRLAVPVAKDSLSQPPGSKGPVRVPDSRVNQIVSAMDGMSVNATYMTAIVQRMQGDTRPADPLQEQRINGLKTSIKNTEREIEKLAAQLLRLAVPPRGMPLPIWEAQVGFLRNLIRNMKSVLANLMKQLSDLTGESDSSRGSSASTSTGSANQAYGSLQSTTKSSNGRPIGGGA
jgi:hypothetical protein